MTEINLLRKDMDAGFASVRAENQQLRTEMDAGFKQMRADMRTAIADSQRTMILILGSIVVGTAIALGAAITLVQLLI